MARTESRFTSVEICAGAGGQAVGLHEAGFRHLALIEIDDNACETLELNVTGNPEWGDCKVLKRDLTKFDVGELSLNPGELDLLAGGVPCPPFSAAGKQLGEDDERDLFPTMLSMVETLLPKAVMIENVRGLLEPPEKFRRYREEEIARRLHDAGYVMCYWKVLEACDYGVPQLRPRAILVAMREEYAQHFQWTDPEEGALVTVAQALAPSMRKRFEDSGDPRWEIFYERWLKEAEKGTVAPTLVGGSKKHGGADLGPSRAKEAWRKLGVCGMGVANDPEDLKDPERDLFGARGPKLTVRQAATIQGFPESWKFAGRKTAAYRQVGNAFPPPVAQAVGQQIIDALEKGTKALAASQADALFEIPAPSAPLGPESGDRGADRECAAVS
ncbi:DNA-cytosine methyltransferase [Streptomyces bingchenggensis BCW-1]|uniref:Cytosine-specific methyltransferase n=1 Tax=Streptomyces bingchenggensis (strain BCW-1) TaxID=749414 RepID=D7CEJ4_STRBB|nr:MULTISPECIES: DNA (cytosine-5-)-methyltransferase [Streptomyces]ADI08890.1 DNA-cytosine methyltransferase [Streptomyces bingchenggensis BCW-1]